jgi:hypothetical protein
MKKYICKNHTQMEFLIPENVKECISFNSFQEIKSCELHLENNLNCQLIEMEEFVNFA